MVQQHVIWQVGHVPQPKVSLLYPVGGMSRAGKSSIGDEQSRPHLSIRIEAVRE